MKFSYAWLKELVPAAPSPSETAELLTMHAFEVEEVSGTGESAVLDIDILPNRMADASSHIGVARDLAAILTMQGKKAKLVLPDAKLKEDKKTQAADVVSVNITDTQGCPFYAARVVTGLSVKASPAWLKKRLELLGLDSINNVVDVANVVMLETGQPLHAFDAERLTGGITVRKAKKGEKMAALDGETYTLDSSVTVIADEKGPQAIAGIKGGADSGVSDTTTTIVLEAALFDAAGIYRASRLTGISTDASKRFEAGRTTGATLTALDRAASLITEIAGGDVAEGVVSAGSETDGGKTIALSIPETTRMLGVAVSAKDARRALEALGCGVDGTGDVLRVVPPQERTDLSIAQELVEEVGRLLGYRVAQDAEPVASIQPAVLNDRERWSDAARDALVREGFREVMRYSFVSEALLQGWGMGKHPKLAIANPQSADYTHLRPTLLPNLLQMTEAERKQRKDVRIFEVGSIFLPKPKGDINELRALGFVIAHETLKQPEAFVGEHAAYFEVKGVAEELFEALGVTDVQFRPMPETYGFFAEGRSATVYAGERCLGNMGELDAHITKKHPQLGSFAVAEFDLHVLSDVASGEHEYREPSKYPEVFRDVAIMVPLETTADEVNQLIVTAGPTWLRDVDLFDYYEGDKLPDGMKSLAFRLAYQSDEKTLTDAEVNKAQKHVEDALTGAGYTIR